MISDMHYKKDETMKMCYDKNIPLTAYILDPDEQAKVDKLRISFENAYKLLRRHAGHKNSGHKNSGHKNSGHKTIHGESLSPMTFRSSNQKKSVIPSWAKAIGIQTPEPSMQKTPSNLSRGITNLPLQVISSAFHQSLEG